MAHVTHDSDTTFKLKRSKDKITRPLYLSAALTLKAAAAVSVGTYSAWKRLLSGARGAWAPMAGGEGRGILCRHAHSLFYFEVKHCFKVFTWAQCLSFSVNDVDCRSCFAFHCLSCMRFLFVSSDWMLFLPG